MSSSQPYPYTPDPTPTPTLAMPLYPTSTPTPTRNPTQESILDPLLIRAFESHGEEERAGEGSQARQVGRAAAQGEQEGSWMAEGHAWLRRRVARSFGAGAEVRAP